ncbi:metallophosphoesterase [Flavobacterium sp. FPG59]|jgi:UDP-2,3-diacylglucosamine pyrophosphatase LpxH|uniref:metallophosphoesterase n=1 Tax=Flavobacterium sp. FPG59 TaxID=1929267 RepID=UPI000A370819|nr:metallophosphoesterase [Flavobacterium sp. FPG59]OUD36870.1 serine/threonine protein phosphatase [Flavobacterium sp. FPG59]
MSSQKRLTRAYTEAARIPFDDTSKFILFSDCHRSDNSFADDFADNRNVYFHAMTQYYKEGFSYFELGDGDELWENVYFKTIFEAHKSVYLLLKKFHDSNRYFKIWGNHEMNFKDKKSVEKILFTYTNTQNDTVQPLFTGIQCHEALVLQHKETKQELFLTHGHQADYMNYVGWKINRFLVRILWRPLQIWGISDPTSPAKNYVERIKIELRIKKWIANNNRKLTIVGHTHRPCFSYPNAHSVPYFNDGSCVHPRSITGIEIVEGTITLIKWFIDTKEDGTLQVVKEILEGPTLLKDYI